MEGHETRLLQLRRLQQNGQNLSADDTRFILGYTWHYNRRRKEQELPENWELMTDFTGADLEGAYLEGCNLCGLDLQGANLRDAHLKNCEMAGAKLSLADLTGAYIEGRTSFRTVTLWSACLEGVAFPEGHDLSGRNLSGCNFAGASIVGACMRGADLTGTNFDGCVMTGVTGLSATMFRNANNLETIVDPPTAVVMALIIQLYSQC
jgi:uncharacterized protein YjbI with pentapeptide repeats